MVVRLRLQRFGRTHKPFYRIVAADSRAPRDGKHLEVVSENKKEKESLDVYLFVCHPYICGSVKKHMFHIFAVCTVIFCLNVDLFQKV